MSPVPELKSFSRIVVKVGSSLLVEPFGAAVKRAWLERLADDLAGLHKRGAEVLVVSSGAVALGRGVLGLPGGALPLEDSQAAAAVGQIALAHVWTEVLAARGLVSGQILVTFGDTEERRRYLYARECLTRLLKLRAVPIINENDTVATAEIRYGD
ncbi:MAG TPA: glutamate 5-kinase, partial [Methylocystis sp.]|nr:glutamate 5-kinase [Methylocystis sp.]